MTTDPAEHCQGRVAWPDARDALGSDPKGELVELLCHKAFYPVLMANRCGPNRSKIERVREMVRAEIDRVRNCQSAGEVVLAFRRDLQARPGNRLHAELRSLGLSSISDISDEFDRKAQELGF